MTPGTNRAVLATTGALVFAAGLIVLVTAAGGVDMPTPVDLSGGLLGTEPSDRALLIGAGCAVLILLVGLTLLGTQFSRRPRPPRSAELSLSEGPRGATTLKRRSVQQALAADVQHLGQVAGGDVRIVDGGESIARARITVHVQPDAPLDAVVVDVGESLSRAAAALGVDALPAVIRIDSAGRTTPTRVE